jgi:hypothetical protein
MLEIVLAYKFYLGKPSREVITWTPRQGWQNCIETDLTETECESDDRICISQWQAVCYGNKALVVKQIECLIDKAREYLEGPFCSVELRRYVASSPETKGPIEDLSCLDCALLTGSVLKDISNTVT